MNKTILFLGVICFVFAAIIPTSLAQDNVDIGQTKTQIISLIKASKYNEADEEIAKIMVLPVSYEKGVSLQQIAGAYQNAGQADKAIELSEYVLQNWPKEGFAIWTAMSKALSLVGKDDIESADNTVEFIRKEFSNHPELPRVLLIIADNFLWHRMYDKAQGLYYIIIDSNNPSSNNAKLGIAGTEILRLIGKNRYSDAQQKVDSIIADFNNQSGLPEMLMRIGKEFCWQRQYGESKEVFELLIAKFSESSQGKQARLWSVKTDICALIKDRQYDQALADTNNMMVEFKDDTGLPEAVYWISGEFQWTKQDHHENSVAQSDMFNILYHPPVEQPDNNSIKNISEWEKKRTESRTSILMLMGKGNQNEIDEAFEQMLVDLTGQPEDIISDEMYWVATWYEKNDKPDKAKDIYECIIVNYPDSMRAKESVLCAIRLSPGTNETCDAADEAEQIANKLNNRLGQSPRLVPILFTVGEACKEQVETNGLLKSDPTRAKKYLEKAADIYNEAIRLAGNEEATARIYMRIAECYCAVQRFDDALNCYKEIIIKWPDSKAEAECLKGIGKYYEELEKQGQINQIQFESELEQLCKELIGKYPESPQTAEMLIKLGWTKFRHGKLDGSIQWFEEGLAKSPACCKPPDALYIVGRYYQQNGKYEKAIVAYQELLKILPAGSPQIEIVNQKLQQINEISQ